MIVPQFGAPDVGKLVGSSVLGDLLGMAVGSLVGVPVIGALVGFFDGE